MSSFDTYTKSLCDRLRRFLNAKVWGGVFFLMLFAAVCYAMTTDMVERWACNTGVKMLSEKLNTRVRLDSISVRLLERKVTFYGFEIDDRKQEKMLVVDTFSAKVQLLPLFDSKVVFDYVRLNGVRAFLYKERRDTAENFRFVIDALKSQETKGTEDGAKGRKTDVFVHSVAFSRMMVRWDVFSEPIKKGDSIDMNHLCVEDIHAQIDSVTRQNGDLTLRLSAISAMERVSGMSFAMETFAYRTSSAYGVNMEMDGMRCVLSNRRMGFQHLLARQQGTALSLKREMEVEVDSMTFFRDNGKPHKRTGKPHRGYFDAGHIDVVANIAMTLRCVTADSIVGSVRRLRAYDRMSGLHIRNLTADVTKRRDTLTMSEMRMSLRRTEIKADTIQGVILRNDKGKVSDVRIKPFQLTARVFLRDIAKPFAPVLSDFTTPLNLRVTTSGTLERMLFNDIDISTSDKRLRLTACGDMRDVLKRFELRLHFNDIHLTARRGIKEVIVGHFSNKVRMKMLRQIRKIGDIRYCGKLTVRFKRQDVSGTLFTKYGNTDFAFTINGRTKEMTGSISTDSIGLGGIMNVKGLGHISVDATYGFNVASKRTRPTRNGGRLPIGWLKAHVDSARFRMMNFRDITAVMHSDGATAEGEVYMPKKIFDISILFWYTQTDSVQDLKFKPRLLKNSRDSDPFPDVKKWKDYMREARERRKAMDEQFNRKENIKFKQKSTNTNK